MGSRYQKKLSQLRSQFDESRLGSIGLLSAFFASLLFLVFFSVILPRSAVESSPNTKINWMQDTARRVEERANWLERSVGKGTADRYWSFSKTVVDVFIDPDRYQGAPGSAEAIIDIGGWFLSVKEAVVSSILRLGFIFIPFWFLWLIAGAIGFAAGFKLLQPHITKDVLGICSRAKGPFYSGIYGPFRPNNGISGSDLSCPSLACPQLEDKSVAEKHELVKVLKEGQAYNQTNLELIQVILAHKDFPSFVGEEQIPDDEPEQNKPEGQERPADQGYITNVKENLEVSSLKGLRAVLEAHRLLVRFYRDKKQDAKISFHKERKQLEELVGDPTSLSAILVLSLTAERRRSLAALPVTAVASAYLALEAGKSLVYKRIHNGYSQCSRFPHLQSRAVIQSIYSYHTEYNGELRLNIRQAIICSRRHADFGRVFVPHRMPIASRGLRDWLEILYAEPEKQRSVAELAELDGHISEIHLHWRQELHKKLLTSVEKGEASTDVKQALQNGVVYKSVVLISLKHLLEIALRGIGQDRQERILKLVEMTRKERATLGITARLPGYKRQAGDLEEVEMKIFGTSSEKKGAFSEDEMLKKKWLMMRRILMHYNWLSTRVGDDSVPSNGLVQGIVTLRNGEKNVDVVGLESLVPLRQQRFRELLGVEWERKYYPLAPHPEDIELFIDDNEYQKTLKSELQAAATLSKGSSAKQSNILPRNATTSG